MLSSISGGALGTGAAEDNVPDAAGEDCANDWHGTAANRIARVRTTGGNNDFITLLNQLSRVPHRAVLKQLTAVTRTMTLAPARRTVSRFSNLAVGTNAGLRVQTPEQPLVRRRNRGVRFRENELSFPAQGRTEIRMIGVEAIEFAFHAAPPAAFIMARFTATRAS